MNFHDEINTLKTQLRKAEEAKIKAETELEQLTKQQNELTSQLLAEGVTPEDAPLELERLKLEIESAISKAKTLIPIV